MSWESDLISGEANRENRNGEYSVESSNVGIQSSEESTSSFDSLLAKLDDIFQTYKSGIDFFNMGEEETAKIIIDAEDAAFDEVITELRSNFDASEDLISEYISRRDSIVSPLKKSNPNKGL